MPAAPTPSPPIAGFVVQQRQPGRSSRTAQVSETAQWLYAQGVAPAWLDIGPTPGGWSYRLTPEAWQQLAPGFDTLGLYQRLPSSHRHLTLETLVALLAGPVPVVFPAFEELCAHVAARRHTCVAGAATTLAFATETAERPEAHWRYHEDTGFTLTPRTHLVDALQHATQPAVSGALYSFSCYRATEYVLLLGLSQTLAVHNPRLLLELENQWRHEAIASARFHNTFLHEIGTAEAPIPMGYYTPGDRVWFRNPDEVSADVTGFEGSWVVYVGQGRFTDFWRPRSHYTLDNKCLEIYHWRHAVVSLPDGKPSIDETRVWSALDRLADPTPAARAERQAILQRMLRYRDPRGVYGDGGCIDSTREFLKPMCPETNRIHLPLGQVPQAFTPATARPI